jgi:hypothetical protein
LLKIDGQAIGTYASDRMAEGVNLAVLDTPMMAQAREVHELTLRHNNIHFERWRRVEVPMAGYESPKVRHAVQELIQALDEEEAGVVKVQRAKARPVPRSYELIRQ